MAQKFLELAKDIVKNLRKTIKEFPSLNHALEELPYPRARLLSHLFNTTIYCIIFSKIYVSDHEEEIALCAIFHDIDLSESHF